MGKTKTILILILIAVAFGAGVYFKDDVVKFYNNFGKQVQDFQKTEIGSIISQASKQILAPVPLNVGGKATQVVLLKSKIISETNLQRYQNANLPALKESVLLDNAASAKANDMFKNQYFEHISPAGVGPATLVQNYGYNYIIAGENLILGNFASEKEVVQDWMDSPGHRENILNNRYTEIGVAIIKGNYKGETVWIGVQEFGLPLSSCAQPDSVFKNQIDLDKAQLDLLISQIDERKAQIENTNPHSAGYNQMVNDFNKMIEDYNLLAETTKNLIAQYNNQANIFNNCVAGE
jgi:uncharacterized protein YkwD